MAPYLSHDGRRPGRLERLELFERLLAGPAVVDGAAERGAEGVLNDGVFGVAVRAGDRFVEGNRNVTAVFGRRRQSELFEFAAT